MKYSLATLFLALISFLSACRETPSGPPILDRQQYALADSNRCDTTTNHGVDVAVSYFLLRDDSRGTRLINDSLRQLVVSSIVGWLDSAVVASQPNARADLAQAAGLFADSYRSMARELGGLEGCWELKTTVDTAYAGKRVLTAKFETYAYTGGAHPNSNLSFYTFDRETGQMLGLTDMVSDTTALLDVVEQVFRKQQQVPSPINLEERGYFLRDGKFFLPANVGLSRQGMVFYYNPYEIAAYAVGPIELTVPYEQLNGILREGIL